MRNHSYKLNIIFFFFEDDYFKWPLKDKLNSLVDSTGDVRIIGVVYPISPLTLFSNPVRFIKYAFRSSGTIRDGISFFAPFGFLPVRFINKHRFLIKVHRHIFKLQLSGYLKRIDATSSRVIWIYSLEAFPSFGDSVQDNKLLVYDCEDDNSIKEDTVIEEAKAMEDQLLDSADVVLTVSQNVCDTRKEKNSDCFAVQNGVDYDFFSKADHHDTKIDKDLINIKRPIVGYLGNIRAWLDFEMLELFADNFKEVSFVFVGPVAGDVAGNVSSLKKRPNVYFINRKDRIMLPGILKGFDICMIPFKYNKFNLATNPLKFWEYLATGKPILSLRIPDIEPYEDILYLYMNKEEAVEKLRVALSNNDPDSKRRRMEIARENDLSARSKAYHEILMRYLSR